MRGIVKWRCSFARPAPPIPLLARSRSLSLALALSLSRSRPVFLFPLSRSLAAGTTARRILACRDSACGHICTGSFTYRVSNDLLGEDLIQASYYRAPHHASQWRARSWRWAAPTCGRAWQRARRQAWRRARRAQRRQRGRRCGQRRRFSGWRALSGVCLGRVPE